MTDTASPTAARVRLLMAHPGLRQSRANAALWQATAALDAAGIDRCDLYAQYPDYDIDVAQEQAALEAAHTLVWQYPIHWYGLPPLLQLWLDEVLTYGWAYGPGGQALAGKRLQLIVTAGGTPQAYSAQGTHGRAFEDFLAPAQATARLCGMLWQPPLLLLDAHREPLQPWIARCLDALQLPSASAKD
ncbi:NAD(P)H-dependent oxidoreductase [Amphibiibacter pelophylacis]|uniref:NAD(P)H-dependent oxidoreductase n=1 Tax=Amphibiibacter pelophylacis TaxID=1799477 RepID=A0ACC6NZE2_9BURK